MKSVGNLRIVNPQVKLHYHADVFYLVKWEKYAMITKGKITITKREKVNSK